MEPFENEEYIPEAVPQEPIPQNPQQPQSGAYHAAGTGRKESPYANSPYEMNHASRQAYQYQPQSEPPLKPKKAKKHRKFSWKGVIAGVVAVTLTFGGWIAAFCINEHWEDRTEDMAEHFSDQISDLKEQIGSISSGTVPVGTLPSGMEYTPGAVYRNCVNSVVAISCTIQSSNYYGATGTSTGSGFILSEDGYVATNYHVVEGATEISVITHDGTEYPAELIGYDDSANDLAVLKVEATGLNAATVGSSSDIAIGDMVVAIGNPLGELTSTQTVGYVSGIGREVATGGLTTISMIQTDAAINPGNSGGPLFNMRGEVIGITTAKYSGTTGSGATIEGIGFAIPIDHVMSVMDDLIDFGYVTGAYMGVSVQNTDEESASMFGLPTGAYIVSVEKDGAAERAGIKPKDIVIKIGDHDVSNVTDLTLALRNFKAGDTTTVTVIRSGSEVKLEITLDEKPRAADTEETQPSAPMPSSGDYDEWFDYFRRYFGG